MKRELSPAKLPKEVYTQDGYFLGLTLHRTRSRARRDRRIRGVPLVVWPGSSGRSLGMYFGMSF